MIKLSKILHQKNGNGVILACVIVLSLILTFSVISEYLRLQMIAKGIRDALQSSIISVATINYDDVYNGLIEGYSGGYTLSSQDQWQEKIDKGSIYFQLDQLLGLKNEGGYHIKHTTNAYEYRLSDLKVSIINASLAPSKSSNTNNFKAEAYIKLEVPIGFGFDMLPPLVINLRVNAGYTPKF